MLKSNTDLFEEHLEIINREIAKRQNKWTLTAIPAVSFEDMAQELRIHIYKKIHLYDSSKSIIECWLNALITNQIRNKLRNLYMNFNKPCISCACAEGEDGCALFGERSNVCKLYENWLKSKQQAYNTKLPLPIENHEQETYDLPHNSFNMDETADHLHIRMKEILKPIEWIVYNNLYILENSDKLTIISANEFDLEKNFSIASLYKIKKTIIEKVKNVLKNKEIDIVES